MKNKVYSATVKEQAKLLRREGCSLTEIGQRLGAIPKNTVQGWVAGIKLTLDQQARLHQKISRAGSLGRPLALLANQRKHAEWMSVIRARAQYFAELPWKDDTIARLTCGLFYLCEGGKYPSARMLVFGNSDPAIIHTFLTLLRRVFGIDEQKLRCRISYRCDQDHEQLKRFWSGVTQIPVERFYRSKPDARTLNKPTRRTNYHGVCVIFYMSTALQLELQSIGESILRRNGGAEGDRTPDLQTASLSLSLAELLPRNANSITV